MRLYDYSAIGAREGGSRAIGAHRQHENCCADERGRQPGSPPPPHGVKPGCRVHRLGSFRKMVRSRSTQKASRGVFGSEKPLARGSMVRSRRWNATILPFGEKAAPEASHGLEREAASVSKSPRSTV